MEKLVFTFLISSSFLNIQADTEMRESIADDKPKESGGKTERGNKSEE